MESAARPKTICQFSCGHGLEEDEFWTDIVPRHVEHVVAVGGGVLDEYRVNRTLRAFGEAPAPFGATIELWFRSEDNRRVFLDRMEQFDDGLDDHVVGMVAYAVEEDVVLVPTLESPRGAERRGRC